MAIGPFVAIESEALRTLSFEGGVEWLVPAWAGIPFVFAAGGFERSDSVHAYEPGVLGAIFWGSHSYNFEGPYALSAALFVEGRRGLGDEHDLGFVAGVSFDVTLLAYPFILAAGALRSD